MVLGVHSVPARIQEIAVGGLAAPTEANCDYAGFVRDSFSIHFVFLLSLFSCSSNPWLLDVLHLCLQRDPLRRPPIDGPNGLLQHPFLQPQCVRAMQLYKEMTMKSVTMHETVRQIHALSKDERWKMEGSVPMVTKVGVELDSDD